MSKEWWIDDSIEKMWVVAQPMDGRFLDGQVGGWMPEGLYKTEEEALAACKQIGNPGFAIAPIPVGILCGTETPDGMYFPLQQTREEGLQAIRAYRKILEEQKFSREFASNIETTTNVV
jgi:hypothetical protein